MMSFNEDIPKMRQDFQYFALFVRERVFLLARVPPETTFMDLSTFLD